MDSSTAAVTAAAASEVAAAADGGATGPGWSTSLDLSLPPNSKIYTHPVTPNCLTAMADLLHNNTDRLAVATEATSHPAGLTALLAQPWLYAGGGLGNGDECLQALSPTKFQTCLAGAASSRDATLPFAGVCLPVQCTAHDLVSPYLLPFLHKKVKETTAFAVASSTNTTSAKSSWKQQRVQLQAELGQEYVLSLERIHEINKFLDTGWTCGNFRVPWEWIYAGPFLLGVGILALLTALGTTVKRTATSRRSSDRQQHGRPAAVLQQEPSTTRLEFETDQDDDDDDEEKKLETTALLAPATASSLRTQQHSPQQSFALNNHETSSSNNNNEYSWWSAFDASQHLKQLTTASSEDTACLDGLRFGSLMWIVLGHVMAIISSTGAGYSNPAQFMPPVGLTTTFLGQLLFSSRLAVDTFLCISGFLVVHVLGSKLRGNSSTASAGREENGPVSFGSIFWRYLTGLPTLVLARVIRILPLYATTLGIYTQLAPHMGAGPFWYQWLGLLQPCQDYGWTNFLFVNNFWPPDTAVADTCFYHSWYLAVDMQLFCIAPLLILLYQANAMTGRRTVAALFLASVATTTYLSWTRHWSINTFDGGAVARYDMEAYAKPHVRAQSYLAGMYVAMILPEKSQWKQRPAWTARHSVAMVSVLTSMFVVSFVTVTGAYSQRPCQYKDWPAAGLCGSSWPSFVTFLYTALSRTVWVVGVAWIIHLCIGERARRQPQAEQGSFQGEYLSNGHAGIVDVAPARFCRNNIVASILSWKCWTPLSKLSFGVYLIHPTVIFVWQLGGRDKDVFRLLSFGLNYVSVCVVSYVAALIAALVVEFPCAALWKRFLTRNINVTPPPPRYTPKSLRMAETSSMSLSSNEDAAPSRMTQLTLEHEAERSYGATS